MIIIHDIMITYTNSPLHPSNTHTHTHTHNQQLIAIFPNVDGEVIEAVWAAHPGALDACVQQLLEMTTSDIGGAVPPTQTSPETEAANARAAQELQDEELARQLQAAEEAEGGWI